MSGKRHPGLFFRWPATLRARIFLILFVGLAVAYGLSFAVLSFERYLTAKELMLGTLENDGVGIAPFHNFEDKVIPDLQAQLDELKAGIIDGSITVTSYLNP